MASITLKNVSKTYSGDVYAVRDLNLEIHDGEFLVLVGPSGCGKSTTLRMIAGLESISSGTLRIGDRKVNDLPPRDRDIAMVFQNYALYPHMTVYQNMAFAQKMRKIPKQEIDRGVRHVAEMLGLESLLHRKPKTLSGGQRQRVALGRAIVRRPAVFLFDEPLSNLDAKLRVEMRAEIKQLHRQLKTTTIYVTHDQEEAMTLGDRVVVMCDGLKRQCDLPLEIYQHPADQFVASFLGMPPMNFLDGQLENREGVLWFVGKEASLRLDNAPLQWLEGAATRKVVAGIRPEAIELTDVNNAAAGQSIAMTVQLVEPLGSTMDVTLQTDSGIRFVCRTPATSLEEGKKVAACLQSQNIHLFEPTVSEDENGPATYGRSLFKE